MGAGWRTDGTVRGKTRGEGWAAGAARGKTRGGERRFGGDFPFLGLQRGGRVRIVPRVFAKQK